MKGRDLFSVDGCLYALSVGVCPIFHEGFEDAIAFTLTAITMDDIDDAERGGELYIAERLIKHRFRRVAVKRRMCDVDCKDFIQLNFRVN